MRTARRILIAGSIAIACAGAARGAAASSPWPDGARRFQAVPAGSTGGVLAAQQGADIWLEGEPAYYRRGDRLNVRFSVPRDSYIAIVHIDSDGMLDFLYPASPWDDGFVRGGRWQSLPLRSFSSTTVWGRSGIGYLYLIASPYPLDFGYFRGGIGSAWDWGYAGRNVYGDPFLAFDQVTRMILPGWQYTDYAWDYHGYYVEGIHRFPHYSCSNQFRNWGWGWNPNFGSCSRLEVFVRNNPYYYDTRRYRGDRRVILRDYDRLDPRYGFKEPPDGRRWGTPSRAPAPPVRNANPNQPGQGEIPRRDPVAAPSPGAGPPPDEVVPSRPGVPTREAVAQPRATEPARGSASPSRSPAPSGSGAVPRPREPAARPAPAQGRPAPEPQSAPSGERTRPSPQTGTDEPASRAPASGTAERSPARRPAL